MASFFVRHPFLSGVITFGIVFVGVALGAFLLGLWIMTSATCSQDPGDPCDGPAMLTMSIWMLAIPAAIVSAMVSGAIASVLLRHKKEMP